MTQADGLKRKLERVDALIQIPNLGEKAGGKNESGVS